MLRLQQVHKYYRNVQVLDAVSFSVNKGEIIGLAGPSGSGKSTLLRCIQGIEPIDSGLLHCEERPNLIFQDFQLFPHMTVLENIIYAPVHVLHWPMEKAKEKAQQLLKSIGLKDKASDYPSQLSGGQKQRVAIIRALAMEAEVLLLDEPTSALDVHTTKSVVTLLKDIHNNTGVTLIVASHDLDFLGKLVKRIIIFKKGRIICDEASKCTFDEKQQQRWEDYIGG